jgi:hypothetical protein
MTFQTLSKSKDFSLRDALLLTGWPEDFSIDQTFEQAIIERAIEKGILTPKDDKFSVGEKAESLSITQKKQYELLRRQFLESLKLKIRRKFSGLSDNQASEIAQYVDASLVGFFRECGLSLSTTLVDRAQKSNKPIPSSIIKFINQAAAKYNDLLRRQAFSTVAVDIFSQPEVVEREYLGRISQGFFAFHALGLFGDAAKERLDHAKQTVWLIDSSLQIPVLALAAPTNAIFRDAFTRLKELGIRLFTTEKLFEETEKHLRFAEDVIQREGIAVHNIIAAATGQPPYRKANQFLEGFIRWQAAGNANDWQEYMYKIFEAKKPNRDNVKNALDKLGIEVYSLNNWPGYQNGDFYLYNEYEQRIVDAWEKIIQPSSDLEEASEEDPDILADFYKKAGPEADAMVITTQERLGKYYMLSEPNERSLAWFISQTSMLNSIDDVRITWQPEAFLRFSTTLAPDLGSQSANRAFELLLFNFTQLGVSLLDDKTLQLVFGGVIDQALLDAREMRAKYEELLSEKYSETPDDVLKRLKPIYRPAGVIQLQNEILTKQSEMMDQYETTLTDMTIRAHNAEKKTEELQHIQQMLDEKRRKQRRKSRQIKSRKKKK